MNLVQIAATLVTSGVTLMACWHGHEVVRIQKAPTSLPDGGPVDWVRVFTT